jgi:hypothetical protein
MTNTTLPETAQLFSQGETLREGEAAPTTPLDRTAVELRSRTRVRPALKGSTNDK